MEHHDEKLVPHSRFSKRNAYNSLWVHFHFRILHCLELRKSWLSTYMCLCLSTLPRCFPFCSWLHWFRNNSSCLESYKLRNYQWNGLTGSSSLWSQKQRLLVWFSADKWKCQEKSSLPKCNIFTSLFSSNSWNGLGYIEPIRRFCWTNRDGLLKMLVDSIALQCSSKRILH